MRSLQVLRDPLEGVLYAVPPMGTHPPIAPVQVEAMLAFAMDHEMGEAMPPPGSMPIWGNKHLNKRNVAGRKSRPSLHQESGRAHRMTHCSIALV